ncbi:STAS domain-containing protein [Winogradskyella flava]|uniref:STAS domain-containing protein n=1 Tax=Winogradskyella flava TaxID=1884876 RepID=UPI0024918162|nr:STAS domain-containing protein [Winogradskyella flava]
MALTIKEKHGVFIVEGVINSSTAQHFQNHCETLLNTKGELTIHIENVVAIDESGIKAIETLYKDALKQNRGFMVIGNISKALHDELNAIKYAA